MVHVLTVGWRRALLGTIARTRLAHEKHETIVEGKAAMLDGTCDGDVDKHEEGASHKPCTGIT